MPWFFSEICFQSDLTISFKESKLFVVFSSFCKSSSLNKTFNASLPVAGKSGTISSIGVGTAAEGKIHAKSGYMTRARSYAGYCTTKSNKEILIESYDWYSNNRLKSCLEL